MKVKASDTNGGTCTSNCKVSLTGQSNEEMVISVHQCYFCATRPQLCIHCRTVSGLGGGRGCCLCLMLQWVWFLCMGCLLGQLQDAGPLCRCEAVVWTCRRGRLKALRPQLLLLTLHWHQIVVTAAAVSTGFLDFRSIPPPDVLSSSLLRALTAVQTSSLHVPELSVSVFWAAVSEPCVQPAGVCVLCVRTVHVFSPSGSSPLCPFMSSWHRERETKEWLTDVGLLVFVLLFGFVDRIKRQKWNKLQVQHMPCDLRHLSAAASRWKSCISNTQQLLGCNYSSSDVDELFKNLAQEQERSFFDYLMTIILNQVIVRQSYTRSYVVFTCKQQCVNQ